MIGWMQKHKKYLIVVIWISTIAFVGAGFVGWGSYSFSSASNVAAVVGDRKISIDRLQREYARLYNMYNQLFNGALDDEQAKKIGIEEQALNTLISRALMLNYAIDLGLRVQESEILKTLTSMQEFQNNGVFDENIYKRLLADNQLRPKDFEEELKEGILLQKLSVLLEIPLTPLEMQTIQAALFSEDHIKIKILDDSLVVFNPKEEEIKSYWEENKDVYQTERGYEISSVLVPLDAIKPSNEDLKKYYEEFKNQFLDDNGQLLPFDVAKNKVLEAYKASQAQKESLKEYIALRKGENAKAKTTQIFEGDTSYSVELFELLSQAKEQDTIKPIKTDKGYMAVRVLKIIPSMPKEYSNAKKDAREDLIAFKKALLLEERAKSELANFKGADIGYISRENQKEVAGLNLQESQEFITQLFNKTEAKSYIVLKDKVILYEIIDQRLKKSDIMAQNLDFLTQNGMQAKARLVDFALMDYLSKFYKIVRKI